MNQPNINIQSRRTVRIDALLDYDGSDLLAQQINALEMLPIKPPEETSSGQAPQLPAPETNIDDLIG